MNKVSIGEAIGNMPSDLLYKEDTALIDNSTGIGIEVEIENCLYAELRQSPTTPLMSRFIHEDDVPLPDLKTFWKVVKDGSLREGTEFIFSGPLVGANIVNALQKLDDFFKAYINPRNNRGVTSSDRCSIHVHLDVRRLSDEELTNLILVYLLFERFIFLAIDPSRIKNNYCRPLTDSSFKYILNEMLNISNNQDRLIRILQSVAAQCDKYSALNILPITSKGSVEFRHHQGTTEPLKLINWINIIFCIKEAAKNYKVTQLIEHYENDGLQSLINLVFNNIKVYDETPTKLMDVQYLINSGVNDVKEIIYMGALSNTDKGIKSRTRPINTLLYKFKAKHNLIKVEKGEK